MVNAKTRNQWKARLESTEALTSSARDGKGEAEVQQAPDTSGEVSKRKKSWSRKRKLGEVHEEQKSSGAELRADSNKGTMGSSNPRVPAQQMARKKVIYRAMERTRDVDDDAPAKTNINPNIPEKEAVVYSEKNGKRKVLGLKVRKHGKEKVGHVVSCHRRELNPNRKRRNLLNGLGEVSKDVVNLAGPRTRGMVKPGTGDQAGTARIKKRKQLRPEEKAAAPTIAEGELTGAEVSLFPVEETVKRPNVDLPINSSNLPSSNKTAAIAPLDIPTDISGLRNGPLQAEAKLSKPGRLRKNGKSISKVHLLKEKRDRLPKPVSPRVTRGMKGTATHVAGLEKSGSHPSKEDPKSGSNIHEPLAQPAVPTIAVETSSMQLRNHKKVREDPNSSGRPRKRVKKNQDKLPADTFQKGLDTVRASDPTSKGRTANGFESFGVIDAAISGGLVNHAETERNRNSSQNKEEDNGGVAHFSSTEARGSKMDSTSGIEPQVGHALLTPVQGLSVQCIEGGVETKTDKDRSRTNECTEGDVRKGTRLGRMKQREMKQIDPGGGDSVPNKKPSGSCRDVLQHEKTHKCKLTEESPQLRRGRSNNPQLGKQDAQNLEGMILEGTGRTQKPVELAEMRVKTPNEKSVQLERTDGRCQRIDHQHLASKTESWQGRSGKNRDYKGQEELSQASPVPKRRKTGSSRLVTPKSMVTEGKSKVVLKMAHSIKVTESFSGQGVDSNDVQSEGSGGQRSLLRDVVKVTPQASQVGLQAGDGNTPDQGEPCPCDSEGQQKHSVELCAPQECITCLPQMSISTIVTGDGRTFKETFDEVNLKDSSCERDVTPEIVQLEQGEGRAEPLNEAVEVTQTPSSVRAELVLESLLVQDGPDSVQVPSKKKKIWRRRNYGCGTEFQRITRARDSKGKSVSDIESQGDKNVTVADAVSVEHVEINAEAVVSTTQESKGSPHLEQAAAQKEDLERGKSLLHVSDLLYKCASSSPKDDIAGATIEHETEMKVIEAQKSLVPECSGADVFAVQEEEKSAEPTSLPSSGRNPFEESKTAVQGELSGEQFDQPASSTVSLPYCEQRSINVPEFFSRLPDSPDGPFALEDKSLIPHSGEEKASNLDDGSLHLEVSHSPYFEKTCAQDSNRFGAAHGAYSEQATLEAPLDDDFGLRDGNSIKSRLPEREGFQETSLGKVADKVEQEQPTPVEASVRQHTSDVKDSLTGTCASSEPCTQEKESTTEPEPSTSLLGGASVELVSSDCSQLELTDQMYTNESSDVAELTQFVADRTPQEGKVVPPLDHSLLGQKAERGVDLSGNGAQQSLYFGAGDLLVGIEQQVLKSCTGKSIAVHIKEGNITSPSRSSFDYVIVGNAPLEEKLASGFEDLHQPQSEVHERDEPIVRKVDVELEGRFEGHDETKKENSEVRKVDIEADGIHFEATEVHSETAEMLTDAIPVQSEAALVDLKAEGHDETKKQNEVREVDIEAEGIQFEAKEVHSKPSETEGARVPFEAAKVNLKADGHDEGKKEISEVREVDIEAGGIYFEAKEVHCKPSEMLTDAVRVQSEAEEVNLQAERHDEAKKENSEVREVNIAADGVRFEAKEVHSKRAEMLTDAVRVQSEAAEVNLKAEGHNETKNENSKVWEVHNEADCIDFEANEMQLETVEMVTDSVRVQSEAAEVKLKADGHDETKAQNLEVREVHIEADGIHFEAKEVQSEIVEMLTDAVRVQSEAAEVNRKAEGHDETKKENPEVREAHNEPEGILSEAKEVHSKTVEMLTDVVRVQSEAAEVNFNAEGLDETKQENSEVREVHYEPDGILFEAKEVHSKTVEMLTDAVRGQSEAMEVNLKAEELNLGVGTVQANVQEVQVDARLVDGAEELDDICVQAEVQEVQVDAQLVDGSEELDHICVQAKLREVQVEAQLVDGAEELDRMSLDGDAESVNAEPEGKQLDMETKEMYVGADDVHSELDWRTGVTEVDARPEVDPEGKDALADKVTNQRERTKERLVGMDNLDTTSTRQPLPSKNLVPGCDSFVSVAGQAMSVPEVDISRPLSTDGKLDQLTGPMTELMNSESVTLDIETHVQHDGQEICAQLNQQDTMLSGQLTSPLEASRCLEGEVLHPEDLSHFQVETQEKDDPKIQPLRVEDPVPQRNMAGVKANLVYKKRKVRSGIETPKEAEGGSRAEDVPSRVHSKKKGFLLASTSIESGGMRIRPRPLDPDQSIPILVEGRDKDFHEYDGGSFYRWVQQQEEAKLKKPTVDQPVADGVGESGGLSIVSRTDLVKKRPIFIPLFRKLPDKQTNSRIVVRPDQDVVLDMQSPLPTPQAYLRHMKPCARKLGHALGGSFCSVPSVYDMDDEDEEWLQACNEILKHSGAGQLLSEDTFEQLMELFEREFYRVCQINDSSLPVLSRSLVEKGGASGRRGKRLVMDSSHRYSRLEASKDGARFSSLSQQEIERRFAPQNRSEDCCICNGGENSDSNPVRRCQICSINVHESCYGICATESNDFRHHAENPNWRCRKCEAVVEGRALPSISCAICCKSGGAMKPTVDPLKWAHVACALYTNETFFIDTEAMEPVDGLAAVETRVKKQRERCGLCGAREGSCVRCSTRGCRTPFHISCGVSQGASFELRHTKQQVEGIRSFCPHHATFVPGTNIDESHHAPSKADDAGEPLPAVSTESSDTLELRHGEQQNMGDEGIGTEDAIMNGAGWQGSFSNTTKLHRSESRRYFRKIRSGERPRAICAGGIIPCNLDPISSPNEVSEKDSHGVSRTLPRSGSMVKEITMQSVLQYMDETDPYVHASDVERLESEAVSAATSASSSHLTTYENVDHTGKATSARDEGDPVNLAAKDKSVTGDAEISHAFSLKFPSLETLDTNLAPSPVVKAVYSFWQVKRVKSKGPILHELRQLQVARSHGIFNKIVHRSTDLLPPVVHDSPARMPVARRPRSLSRDPVFSKFSELRQQLEIVRSIASNGVRREQLKLEDQKLMYESVQQQLLIAREAPRSRRCLWCENTQNLLNCSSCPKAFCFQCFKHRRGYGVKGWIAASRLSEYVCNFCLGSSAQERGWPELSTTFSEPRGTPVSRVALVPGRVGDWNHGLEVRTKPNSGKQVSFLNETSNNPHGSSSSPQHGAAPMTQGRGKMIYTGRPIDALSVHSKFAVPCMNDRSRVVETAYHGGLASSGPNPAGNESRVQLDHPHGEGKKAKRRRVKEANKEAEPETVLRSTKRIKKLARSSSFVYGSEDETTVSESEETRFDKKTVRLSDLRDKEAESHFTNLLEVSAQDKAEKGHPPLKFGIKFSPTGTLIVRRHGPASQHP